MNEQLLTCKCYGAMMHALPRNKQQLTAMSEDQITLKTLPFINRVPAKTEQVLDNWLASTINHRPNQLADLSELADLDGIGKKLKKVAKKVAKAHVKVLKAPVKLAKKAAKSKVIKKIARPLAYAVGAMTGTAAIVAKADQIRTAARKAKAKLKATANKYGLNEPTEQPQVQEQADPMPMFNDTATSSFMPQSSFVETSKPDYQNNESIQRFNQNYQNPVQRLSQEDEKPKIVGLSANGIMDNIKQNPIPWAVGAGALLLLVMRNNNPQPYYPPHYAGGR